MIQSTIRAFQSILSTFEFLPRDSSTFSENFAIKRFQKKFQVPDPNVTSRLHQQCWSDWIVQDGSLPQILRPSREWYIARSKLQQLRPLTQIEDPPFPKGSEFEPTRGRNSIEARLARSRWTVTADAFDAFVELTSQVRALKVAVKRRYLRYCRKNKVTLHPKSWRGLKWLGLTKEQAAEEIWRYKVYCVTTIVNGSRFSTVPKNNDKRRPINVEPFGNMLLQRSMGQHLRRELRRVFDVDLDTLAHVHRIRIRDVDGIATVDLANASDSVSWELVKFMLPPKLFAQLELYRSAFVYGLDGCYHLTKKFSSMGNGFTFELMTLILTAVCRSLDPTATVFGDDIIIRRESYQRLVALLEEVGFSVNLDKSFHDGDFRESCGANYHRHEGYIESYDFLWPESIGDCMMIWNKVVRLANVYPSFQRLHAALARALPRPLHGGPSDWSEIPYEELLMSGDPRMKHSPVEFPPFFVTQKCNGQKPLRPQHLAVVSGWGYPSKWVSLVPGFTYVEDVVTPSTRVLGSWQWAKFFAYLRAGRVTKDVDNFRGEWTKCWFVKTRHWYVRANAECFRNGR
uniref:RNA-directed RNA polymerase n=1 Tax=Ellsworth virus TaxID=2707217 RepID=A0A6H0DK36_9VIRU|nr:MAG: RNA-dependent RNA polymerase [Ellsworth virus]